jgi:hypothetical protein
MLLLTALLSADNSPPAANATDPSSIVGYWFFFPADGKHPKVMLGSFNLSSSPQQLVPLHHNVVSIVCNVCHLAHIQPNSI